MMNRKVRMFGFEIDAMTMTDAVAEISQWVEDGALSCRYVVTPNVHHTVLHQRHEGLRQAYADASLVFADGMPLVLLSRLLGRPLPERLAGSDLVPALFDGWQGDRPLRVFLLGAGAGVADRAACRIETEWTLVRVVGTCSPPFGFSADDTENESILQSVAAASPDILIVGLGAPTQEVWVHVQRPRIRASVALCVGASIDFLAGEKPRAPRWMRNSGLEWVHRLASEPSRLWKRYAHDACLFPPLVWRELRQSEPRSETVPQSTGPV